jgi:alpha-tubulin suppressor-like RCC1 family protein
LEAAGQTPILDAQTGFAATQMEALTDGTHHGCAVKAGGSVWCWRKDDAGNIDGQIGNGAKGDSGAAYRATRVLVSANTPLASASGLATWAYDYWSHTDASCAITSAGKLYCWGSLTWLVNNGTPLSSPYAQAITSDGLTPLTGVVQATAGDGRSACAVIQTAGSSTEVHCWGQNDSYNLGQGDTIKRQYPTKVVGLANPTKVVIAADGNGSGPTTTCALDGGQVRCWGYNASGTCGVNAAAGSITAPTLVKLQSGTVLDQIIDLRATGDQDGYGNGGSATVCALRSDQTIWCWGKHYNAYASNYGVTNVVALGSTWVTPRYVTSDGVYHIGSQQAQTVNCGSLR